MGEKKILGWFQTHPIIEPKAIINSTPSPTTSKKSNIIN